MSSCRHPVPKALVIRLEDPPELSVCFSGVTVTHSGDAPIGRYTGPYELTPTRETQMLRTEGLMLSGDITVHPIPQNYGLITYNGYELTVS